MPPRNFLIIVVSICVSYACYRVALKNRYASIFSEALELVDRQALYDIPKEDLFRSAMKGMLSDLDPHSNFFYGDAFRSFNEDIEGEFGGVGIYFEVAPEEGLYVMAAMPNRPAHDAGLRSGDVIKTVDSQSVMNVTRSDVGKLLRGTAGQTVTVEFERDGQLKTADIVRAAIPVDSVHGIQRNPDSSWSYMLPQDPTIAYLRLTQFGENTDSELAVALKSLPPTVRSIVLDVRHNSGGLLTVAKRICDMFLPADKVIVTIRGRGKKVLDQETSTSSQLVDPSVNVAVLINRDSASASEILAGCLQDHKRAVLVGEQSYGKGTVQRIIHMQNSRSAIKLTTASYWRPSDERIDRYDEESKRTGIWGVHPDKGLEVKLTEREVIANFKNLQTRQIQGLIPEEKQLKLIGISNQNFIDRMIDAERQIANQANASDTNRLPASDRLNGSRDVNRSSPRSSTKNSPDDTKGESNSKIEEAIEFWNGVDFESDPVLDRAIEYLKSLQTANTEQPIAA